MFSKEMERDILERLGNGKVVDRLKQVMEERPSQETLIRFAYAVYTYPESSQILDRGKSFGKISVRGRDFFGVSFEDLDRLETKFRVLHEHVAQYIDLNAPENDPLGTKQYKDWATFYKKNVKESGRYYNEYEDGTEMFRLKGTFFGPASPSEDVYIQHQHICKLFAYFQSVEMQNVYDYIAGIRKDKSKSIALREVEKPTDVQVPGLDKDAVQKAASEIPPLEYKQISGFGVDIETGAGRAMAQLASYFLYNATRAAHTHECLEAAQDEIQNANLDLIVRDDPANWWDRKTTRIRLVDPHDMPMMRLVEQFAKLPDLVELDSQAYAVDLDIADHAIKVCGGYYDVLKAYKEALEGEKDRLVTTTRTDLPTEIATAGIPQQIEQRINSLELTAQHMVQQAENFGSLAQVIATNRSRLGRIAGMPSAVQIPAMDAIRKFNLYQMRRMQLLGGKVDDAVRNQLNVNGDVFESDILDASPQATRRALSDVFDSIRLDLANFQRGLSKDGERQKEIAREIKEQSIETALDIEI